MKFGGASVGTPEKFEKIAQIIIDKLEHYENIIVVVSAMGNTTNELIDLAHKVHPDPPRRELDMMVSVGERISVALLAMALDKHGTLAVSLTGSQSGIITSNEHFEAKILDVRPKRILNELSNRPVIIVAGYQGMSLSGDITTLGRGGSDTTAVALAIALGASYVEFYKDVDGVFEKDPKKYPEAKLLRTLTYEELQNLTSQGAKILHHRCVELASKNQIGLKVIPFSAPKDVEKGTVVIQNPEVLLDYEPVYEG